jgi:hypothetical protein
MEAYKTWQGKPEGKRPLGKLRRIWEDNTKRIERNRILGCGLLLRRRGPVASSF